MADNLRKVAWGALDNQGSVKIQAPHLAFAGRDKDFFPVTFAVVEQSLSKHFCPGWAVSFYSFGKRQIRLQVWVQLCIHWHFQGFLHPVWNIRGIKKTQRTHHHVVPLILSSLPRLFVSAFQSRLIFVLYKCPAFLNVHSGRKREKGIQSIFKEAGVFC